MATQDIFNMTDTWNAAGTTFTAIKMNVTNTASAAGSLLMDLQIGGSTLFSVSKGGALNLPQNATDVTHVMAGDGVLASFRAGVWAIQNGATAVLSTQLGRVNVIGDLPLGFGPTTANSVDVIIRRDAANVLAQRNGTNAQTLRVYGTFTDTSNYERGALQMGSDYVELAAETAGSGDDNMDVRLTPAGTGNVRFGTHSAVGAETITGFITIKDAAGNARKLAVIS